MTIRAAAKADVPALIAMGQHFLAQTDYATRLAANPTQMGALCERLIEDEHGIVLVAERDGELVGMLGVLVFAHPISGECFASEVFWWVEPEHRGCGVRLLKHAEQWATDHGAVQMQMIAPTPQVEQLYQRLGYAQVETLYQRALA